VISDGEIDYPRVLEADLLLAMSQEAYDRFCAEVKGGGVVLVDSILVDDVSRAPAHQAAITRLAEEVAGDRLAANMVALGLIAGLSGIVSAEAVEAAVCARVPEATREANLRALRAGVTASCELQSPPERAAEPVSGRGEGNDVCAGD
jgi:2-oxoglutarate ferredoxin oxidoreductase subunit gamma